MTNKDGFDKQGKRKNQLLGKVRMRYQDERNNIDNYLSVYLLDPHKEIIITIET